MDIQLRREARWAVARHGIAAAIGYLAHEHPEVPFNLVRNIVRRAARLAAQRQDRDIRPVNPRDIEPRNLEKQFDQAMTADQTMRDPSLYQQWTQASFRSGKRRKVSVNQLIRGNIVRTDFWFKGLKQFDNHGHYWLSKQLKVADNYIDYPVYFFAPFHVNQIGVGTTAQPMRRLRMDSVSNLFYSQTVAGFDSGANSSTDLQNTGTAGGVNSIIGPCGVLKWTDFKFNLWGASNKTCNIEIMFVKSIVGDANPFKYAAGSIFTDELQEQLREYLRSKVTNPISTANNLTSPKWKILKKYKFEFEPILTQEGDQDPHVRTVKLFNRWNRSLRFDWSVNNPVDNALGFLNPQKNNDEVVTYAAVNNVRPEEEQDVFVIISGTHYSTLVETDPSNAETGSFDMSFRSSWVTVS